MFELPTRSPIRYSGKYPNRIRSVSYANSPSQQALCRFLDIRRAVHLELNCGRRFIACITEVKMNEPTCGRDISDVTVQAVQPIQPLSQERYDEMLGIVRNVRKTAQ